MFDELPKGFVIRERYRILSVLGRGATSYVYLAKELRGGNLCAIKAISLDADGSRDPFGHADMVLQEARLLTGLSHPGLPKVFEFFSTSDVYFLVMEWVAGQTLYQIMLDRGVPITESETLSWGIEICHILEYLHSRHPRPVVVGDIKPNNLLRTYEGRIKMIDFGIARYSGAGVKVAGLTFVTPGFSPPEQYGKGTIDHRTDIYSVGATLYFLMTGQPLERYRFNVPPLRALISSASAELEATLAQCLQQDRARRYQNVEDLARDLRAAQEVEKRQTNMNAQARDILASLYRSKKRERLDL